MKYVLLSDIHANLEALEAVLAEISDVDEIICLGDIVGYGPNPNECVEKIRKLTNKVIAGNNDKAAIEELNIANFNPNAQRAVAWTGGKLSAENINYLKNLPLRIEGADFEAVHGSLPSPLGEYITNLREALPTFALMTKSICFVGHSHKPLILSLGEKKIINAGSVGQPRDRNPKACYAIYDTEKKETEIFRVEYNLKITQEKMIRADLPAFLVERLALGR